jgi:hypothetical protein
MSLVRSELLKLRTIHMPRWLLLMSIALVVLLVLGTVPTHDSSGALTLGDHDLLARVLAVAADSGWIVMIILGELAYTIEMRFATITPTLLATPNRSRSLVAKAVATACVGAIVGAVTAALALVLSVAVIDARGGAAAWSGETAAVLAASVAASVLASILGVAVGAVVRNQIVTIVATLIWLLVAEQLLVVFLPEIGRWAPGGATAGFVQMGRAATTHGDLLPAWGGGLFLVGYTALFAGAALTLERRRDVN